MTITAPIFLETRVVSDCESELHTQENLIDVTSYRFNLSDHCIPVRFNRTLGKCSCSRKTQFHEIEESCTQLELHNGPTRRSYPPGVVPHSFSAKHCSKHQVGCLSNWSNTQYVLQPVPNLGADCINGDTHSPLYICF